ncbi:MAG: hypothetical protein V4667_13855 [Bacteroidota bacterium]
MPSIFPLPLYRFFSKKEHAEAMVTKGEIFFNTISAFPNLTDDRFRDETEKTHLFKTVHQTEHSLGGCISIGYKHRKLFDAWAFCATASSASTAIKEHCVCINNFGYFLNQVEIAVKNKFGENHPVLFGPVAYNLKEDDLSSTIQHPPYFTKPKQKMTDLEFRIVIPAPKEIKESDMIPLTLTIPNPTHAFEMAFILTQEMIEKNQQDRNWKPDK